MHSYSPWKTTIRRFVPGVLLRARREWVDRRRRQVIAALSKTTGQCVFAGPFAGMRYVTAGAGSALGPKLLGSYETELHPVIEGLAPGSFDVVVNVGAGEGYYAVGFARRMPNVRVVAFEEDGRGRALIHELAAVNNLEARVQIRGWCSPGDLACELHSARSPLVVIDVEGAEGAMLDPDACPALRRATMLVEVHEYLCPGVTDALLTRFSATHTIKRIPTVSGGEVRLAAVPGFLPSEVRLLADEMRPARMEWFWMTCPVA